MMEKKSILNYLLTALTAAAIVLGMIAAYDAPVFAYTDVDLSDNRIPVLSIEIDPEEYQKIIESEDHTYTSYSGSISITVPEGYTGDYGDEQLPSQKDLKLEYLRGRGNSTWMDPKKPFKLKLDKSTDLLGMGANKHWVLLANAFDGTMLRNRIVGYMGRQLGLDFTPMYTPVDLVVNGQYRGSYTLAHQVRIGKTRVNIKELKPTDIAEPEVTGGYLLQYAPYSDDGEGNVFLTERGVSFTANEPLFESEDESEELGAPEQRNYISSYLQQIEDAVYGEGFKNKSGVSYADLMDVRSAAVYWMIQEFTRNTDAFKTPSTYLYKDRGGKLCWGPLWDSDLSFDITTGLEGFNHCEMPWLDYLRTYDPEYQKELMQVWDEYDLLITQMIREGGLLDQYASELKNSWDDNKALADAEHWSEESCFEEYYVSLEEELSKLRQFMTERQKWFRSHIATDLTKACCRVEVTADAAIIDTVYVSYGDTIGDVTAKLEYKGLTLASLSREGFVAVGWNYENGKPADLNEKIDGDMTISVRYIPEADAIFADGLYFGRYEYFPRITEEEWTPVFVMTPENAQESSVVWETSDPMIAEVNEKGVVTLISVGDVEITGKLRSGAEKTYKLHILNDEYSPDERVIDMIPESQSLTLIPGEYGQDPITLVPGTDNVALTYRSDNEDVATVDEIGVVHAISPGTCQIKVIDKMSDLETTFSVIVEDDSKEVAGRKAQLTEYVTAAKRDQASGRYTSDTVKALKTRIAEASDVLDDKRATLRDIDIAQVRLLNARKALKKKSANTLKATGRTVRLKAKRLRKKAQTVKLVKAVNVSTPCGTVKYSLAGVSKSKYKKYFKVNVKTGKITVKKHLKKGRYTVKIKVSAAGNGDHLPAAKTAKVTVKVK